MFFSIFQIKESIALSRLSFAPKSLNWEQPFAEETAASMFRERWHEYNRQIDAWISYMRTTAKTIRCDRQTIYGYYQRFEQANPFRLIAVILYTKNHDMRARRLMFRLQCRVIPSSTLCIPFFENY